MTPKVFDKEENEIRVGSRVESVGFARWDKGRSGPVVAIIPADLYPVCIQVDFGDRYPARFFELGITGKCFDLEVLDSKNNSSDEKEGADE